MQILSYHMYIHSVKKNLKHWLFSVCTLITSVANKLAPATKKYNKISRNTFWGKCCLSSNKQTLHEYFCFVGCFFFLLCCCCGGVCVCVCVCVCVYVYVCMFLLFLFVGVLQFFYLFMLCFCFVCLLLLLLLRFLEGWVGGCSAFVLFVNHCFLVSLCLERARKCTHCFVLKYTALSWNTIYFKLLCILVFQSEHWHHASHWVNFVSLLAELQNVCLDEYYHNLSLVRVNGFQLLWKLNCNE